MRKTVNFLALAAAALGLLQSTAQAQLNLSWEEIGPNNQGNHVRAMAVDGNGTVWAGSVGGGLWKSTDRGSSWSQVSGVSDNMAVSCIAVSGSNIYVGTGENVFYEPATSLINPWGPDSVTTYRNGFLTYAGQPGQGVFVSTDGGATFTHNNGTWNSGSTPFSGPFKSIQKIAVNGTRVFIAALDGLYYSDNNLGTITKAASPSTHFTSNAIVDVIVSGNNVVMAATKDSIFRSTDNGANFGRRINSVIYPNGVAPNVNIGGARILFAAAPSNNNVVYVTGVSSINGNCNGVWKTTDAGDTWSRVAPFESSNFLPFGGKGKYASVIAVHPTDPNSLVLGGSRMYKYSENTGWITTGSSVFFPGFSRNYIPTPQLIVLPDPTTDSSYFVAGDAEIVRTDNFGTTFSFKTKGFNNAHLHAVDGSVDYEILASDRYNGLMYKDNGNSDATLQQFANLTNLSEGGIARWSPTLRHHIVSQGTDGGLIRSLNGGEAFDPFYGTPLEPIHPSIASEDSLWIDRADGNSAGGTLFDFGGAPITPWCFDEYITPTALGNDTSIQETPAYLYMCSKSFVWVCTNPFGGIDSIPHWNRITRDMTVNNLGGNRKEFYTAIASSNDADHIVWVGTNNGRLVRINGANDPINLDVDTDVAQVDDAGMPRRWISDIAIDPNNNNIVAVTYAGYKLGDDRVWMTNNANDAVPTWRSVQANLASDIPAYSVAFSNVASSRAMLIGTEYGLYGTSSDYTNTATALSWSNLSGPMGNVQVTDIVFRRNNIVWLDGDNYKYDPDNTILVATNGRGAFKSRNLVGTPDPIAASNGIKMNISPNPTSGNSTIQLELPSSTLVNLEVFDLQGNRVAFIAERVFNGGAAEIGFDASKLPAGAYLIKGVFTNNKGMYQHTLRQVVVK
jgi:photosystem II stability/assembly factor-like uncharacterized protein